jgi:hypothetical protein
MNVSTKDYVGVIRQLPRPTLAQTERFARYVSSAHSWYKHLPILPKVPFIFYLDPGAGKNLVQTRTGETALIEIKDESTRFHYTWQKTEDYRRRFGCWNYHAAYGSSFRYAGEGGVINTGGAGLRILADSGEWVSVPQDLTEKGMALVSAFVHPCPNLHIWANDPARFGLSTTPYQDPEFPPPAHFLLDQLWKIIRQERQTQPDFGEVGKAIPPQVMEMIKRPVAERPEVTWFAPHEDGWDWPDEGWLEQLQSLGIDTSMISWLVKYLEVDRMQFWTAARDQAATHEFPEWPAEAMRKVMGAIMEERGRQLAAMTDAMGRFVGAVFPS